MALPYFKMRLQGIMVLVFIMWNWIFVLMSITTMISLRSLTLFSAYLKKSSEMQDGGLTDVMANKILDLVEQPMGCLFNTR